MRLLTLKRIVTSPLGTFGVLLDGDEPFCLTCEDQWDFNKQDISCIPTGAYICSRITSPKFGETFEINNVQGRTHILFHKGNTPEDTHGCILLGEKYMRINEKWAIGDSAGAFKEFMDRLEGQETFQILIKWA